jgi:hypothetical protein
LRIISGVRRVKDRILRREVRKAAKRRQWERSRRRVKRRRIVEHPLDPREQKAQMSMAAERVPPVGLAFLLRRRRGAFRAPSSGFASLFLSR